MLTIEVLRHSQGEYFEPWIEDHDNGCTFHFHRDDISEEAPPLLAELFSEQARRWHPRPPGVPRGRRIPVTMELEPVMPYGVAVAVDDRAAYIAYTVRADLISEQAADAITRIQSERSPHWERRPLQRQALRAM